jgi:mRNA-degrading endonuclease RelE of RelBE toxin-antitoxin system
VIFDVVLAAQAEHDLLRLGAADRDRVEAALDLLALTQRGDVRPLTDSPGEYRLRVGDIRVRFTINRAAGTIVVIRVLPRGRAYRG